jgi:Reactive mitochondrial oxygen species modulator 1
MVSDKVKDYGKRMGQGFLMGFSAGICVGLFVGSLTVLTVGPSPGKTYFSTVGRTMIQTGGNFFFIQVGLGQSWQLDL